MLFRVLKKINSNITTKVILYLLISICTTVFTFSFFDLQNVRDKMEKDSLNEVKNQIFSYSTIVDDFVWSLDSKSATTTLSRLLLNKIFLKAVIFDESKKIFAQSINAPQESDNNVTLNDLFSENEINQIDKKMVNNIDDVSKIIPKKIGDDKFLLPLRLYYENESSVKTHVGYFVIEYSTQFISELLKKIIIKTTLLGIALCLIMTIVIFFLLEKLVLKHIRDLDLVSVDLSNHNFNKIKFSESRISDDEIIRLKKNFNIMIDKFIAFLEEQTVKQRMSSELETAKLVQEGLLPHAYDLISGHFELTGVYKSASECGGDWWNFYPLPDDKTIILIGDVTGHGTPSAIIASVVKGYCDSLYSRNYIEPDKFLSELNFVVKNSSNKNKFMTMFCGLLDPKHNKIYFANAAHNFPFLIRAKNKNNIELLIANGNRLGYSADTQEKTNDYEIKEAEFYPGDILFLYSDGLTELRNENGIIFSERKLKSFLKKMPQMKHTSEMSKLIENEIELFKKNEEQPDDITFVICKFRC